MSQSARRSIREPQTSASTTPLVIAFHVLIWSSFLVFWSGALDPYGFVKLTAIGLSVTAIVSLAIVEAAREWRLEVSAPRVAGILGVLLVVAVLCTVVSTNSWRSFVGQRGRATGSVTYVALAAAYAVAVIRLRAETVRSIATSIGLAGAFVATYGIIQRLGLDPLRQTSSLYGSKVPTATLGNANFVSACGGIALPILVWCAGRALDRRRRTFFLVALVVTGLGVLNTRSVQGILAGGTGVTFVVAGYLLPRARAQVRRRLISGIAIGAAAVVLLVGTGLAGHGPLGSQLDDAGRTQRLRFWSASASMIADHPVLGVGFDEFGGHYRTYRSKEDALQYGVFATADEPHNVPLGMLVGGGPLLGLAYLAFVAGIGLVLWRGLRDEALSPDRGLLLAMGGAWLAYQMQSFVSIDEPPLSVLHFVLAGCLVAIAGRRVTLWADPRASRRRRSQPAPTVPWPAAITAGVVAVIGAWFSLLPLRAELAAASGLKAVRRGDAAAAVSAMKHAHGIMPREPGYDGETGKVLGESGQIQAAVAYYARAAKREPQSLTYVVPYARLLAEAGNAPEAKQWYDRALRDEKWAPELKLEVAQFDLRQSDGRGALTMLDAATKLRTAGLPEYLSYGDAYTLVGDETAATANYQKALSLAPTDIDLRLRMGQSALKAGRFDRAIELFKAALALNEDSSHSWYVLGAAYEASGDRAAALQAYLQAARHAPTDPNVAPTLKRLGVG